MIRMFRTFTSMLMIFLFGLAWGQGNPNPLRLNELIEEALKQNSELTSLKNAVQAAQRRVPQAGALPDPVLTLSAANLPINSFAFNQEPMTGKKIAVMQMFPFPGKLGLKEDIAVEDFEISQARLQEYRYILIKEVKKLYFDLFFIDRAIETIQKNTSLVNQFVQIAATKYSVGKGLQQDVLKAQVELSKMEEKLILMRQKREALEAHLNALLNRPAESPVGRPDSLEFKELTIDLQKLKTLADANRPLLRIWRASVKKGHLSVQLAKKDYLPNFAVGVAYTQRDVLQSGMGGVDYLSGVVSVNLPIYFWRKQSKKVEENQYHLLSLQDKYKDVKNMIYASLEKVLTQAQRDARLIDLYKTGIVPQASQSLQSAISGYQTDKVDFLTMLNNQMTLFNYELDYYRFLSDYNKTLAEMEALTGMEINHL